MQAAIEQLVDTLANLEISEPIRRAEGRIEQADDNLKSIAEIRGALVVLTDGRMKSDISVSHVAFIDELYADMVKRRKAMQALRMMFDEQYVPASATAAISNVLCEQTAIPNPLCFYPNKTQ